MKCVYCDKEGKMSREHVIPKGFIEHMNSKGKITALDKVPSRIVNTEITIKDVCTQCNNGELSLLDSYALKLILKYNDEISPNTKKIYFKYKYDRLARWLLKVSYNSARVNDSKYDVSLYKKNVDYIMHRGESASNIAVFAMFMGLDCLSEKITETCDHLKENREFDVDWFRIAPFRLRDDSTYNCASRCVIINSFAFAIIVCDKGAEKELEKIKETINECYTNFVELSINGKVWLKKDDKFFLDSFEGNSVLRDNYLRKRISKNDGKIKILTLTKDEIEKEDFTKIECMLVEYMSNRDDLMDCYQSAIIAIEGYEKENREPYQSKIFQNYFRRIFNELPEIIWILKMKIEIISLQVMISAYVNDNYIEDMNDSTTTVVVNKERVLVLMEKCFSAINKLTNTYAFDFSINQDLTEKFIDVITESLGMDSNMYKRV